MTPSAHAITSARRRTLRRSTVSGLLGDAQHGAAGARIAPDFGLARANGLSDRAQPRGRYVGRAHRHALRQAIARGFIANESLHDAVLERMEADDREAAAALEQLGRLGQRQRELFKLLIDVNPKSLKG